MSNYANLKSAIQSVIKTNGNNEITGQLLQNELLAMITTLGYGYQFMGVASPDTVPGTPDAKVFYIAYTPGTYTNFGGIVVTGLCVLKYATSWTKEDIPVSGGGAEFAVEPTDLTLVSGTPNKLKFADRPYNTTTPDGLGYKILRKDLTFAQQVSDTNTIYEIRYEFDLSGASKTIPSGVILRFNGGCIKNGTIVGDDTRIQYNGKIFDNVTISGTWIVPEIKSSMFADLSNNGLKNLFALQNDNIFNHLVVDSGNYTVGFSGTGAGENALVVTENTDCEINGVVSLDSQSRSQDMLQYGYRMILVKSNSVLHGKGELIGDIVLNKNNTESGHGVYIFNAKNAEIYGLKISDFAGDGICVVSPNNNAYIHDLEIVNWNRNAISIIDANIVKIENIFAHDGGFTSPMAIVDIEPNQNNKVNFVEINGINANNVGVGFQILGQHNVINNVVVKNAEIKDCKNEVLIITGDGGGVDTIECENLSFTDFPANHGYDLASVIRAWSYNRAYFNNVLLDTTDITTERASFCCLFSGARIAFKNCAFIGNSTFTYHLKNASFDECVFNGDNMFWATANGINNVDFDRCEFITGRIEFTMRDSCVRNSKFTIGSINRNYGAIVISETTGDKTFKFLENLIVVTANGEKAQNKYVISCGSNRAYIIGNVIDNSGGEAYVGLYCTKRELFVARNKFLNFAASDRVFVATNPTHADIEIFPNAGATTDRPTIQASYYNSGGRGTRFFDTTLSRPSWFNGSKWVDSEGYKPMLKHGATTDRPTPDAADIGFQFFDETNGKVIVWNGTAWVNVDGSAL